MYSWPAKAIRLKLSVKALRAELPVGSMVWLGAGQKATKSALSVKMQVSWRPILDVFHQQSDFASLQLQQQLYN